MLQSCCLWSPALSAWSETTDRGPGCTRILILVHTQCLRLQSGALGVPGLAFLLTFCRFAVRSAHQTEGAHQFVRGLLKLTGMGPSSLCAGHNRGPFHTLVPMQCLPHPSCTHHSPFVFLCPCSAYRLSPTLFTVIGLGRLHLERTLGPCSWVYRDGREIPGNATVHYAPDHMDKMVQSSTALSSLIHLLQSAGALHKKDTK